MQEFINKLKNKSEKERSYIAFGTAFIFTTIIFFIWADQFLNQIHVIGSQYNNESNLANLFQSKIDTSFIGHTLDKNDTSVNNNLVTDVSTKAQPVINSPFTDLSNMFRDLYRSFIRVL